jgi:molybdate transport system regulatory protein
MSYARAWGLVHDLGETFGAPVVDASPGGKSGGGAKLTPLGRKVIQAYRTAESRAKRATQPQISALQRAGKRSIAKK